MLKNLDEFQYDRNGNVTQDLNRGISSIEYNVLNLPKTIHYNDYSSISNTYTAEGEKQFRLTLINNNAWPAPIGNLTPPNMTAYVTQYCGNMVYSSQGSQATSETLLIDGGYVTFEDVTPKYHFYVQDHLGNNRAVVSQTGAVEQQAQYYPSGAIMTSISEGLSQQPYLYSGKELDRMHALDWYDFGARHYDAALLRWHSMDPLCEKYYHISPYAYCINSPVNVIDKDGKRAEVSIRDNSITISSTIVMFGPNANYKLSQYFQKSIYDTWGALKEFEYNGRKYSITWNIKVRTNIKIKSIDNAKNQNPEFNYLRVDKTENSAVQGTRIGHIRSTSRNGGDFAEDNPMPHEFGHILGHPDKYDSNNNPVSPDWKGNVMSELSGKGFPSEKNLEVILNSILEEHNKKINDSRLYQFINFIWPDKYIIDYNPKTK